MRNMIRADMYRILRSKGFYITAFLLLAFVIAQAAASSKGGIMVASMESATFGISREADGSEERWVILPDGTRYTYDEYIESQKFKGSTAPFEMMDNSDMLLYFLLPFIIFIAAADFSSGGVKNVLSGELSRTKYYLSKLILSGIFCCFVLLINIVVPMIVSTLQRGFGGSFDIEFITRLLKAFSSQLFICLAVTCVGIFLVFATQRTAAVNGAYIAFCILPVLILSILAMSNESLSFLLDYDVTVNLKKLARIDAAASKDIVRAFLIGGFYMLASTAGGLLLFKKAEIK